MNDNLNGDWCWLDSHTRVFVPETEVFELNESMTLNPLCGYGFILAVCQNDTCIGWAACEQFGFETAKECFMAFNSNPSRFLEVQTRRNRIKATDK